MSSAYGVSVSREGLHALFGVTPARRRRALACIDTLVLNPFTSPDLCEQGPSGRIYNIQVEDDLVLTYWVDHAEKDLRILRVEFI